MAVDRPHVRRDPATVKRSGAFPTIEEARAKAANASGAASVEGTAMRGRVVGQGAAGAEWPLANALVSTSDGRVTLTDATGTFAIAGSAAPDGGLVATADGFVTTSLLGATTDNPVVLRLAPRSVTTEAPLPIANEALTVTGRVVDENGAPVPDAAVVLDDPQGATSAPAETDADGQFRLFVFANAQQVKDGILLVAGPRVLALLGPLELSPAKTDIGVVKAQAANRGFSVNLANTALPIATPHLDMILVSSQGSRLPVGRDNPDTPLTGGVSSHAVPYHLADLQTAHFEIEAEAIDPESGTRTALRHMITPEELAQGSADVAFLQPPANDLDPALVINEALEWRPVAGATGYHLALTALDGAGLLWEGVSLAPALPLGYQGDWPPGTYGLTLTAWDSPNGTSITPETPNWRRASRQFRVVI